MRRLADASVLLKVNQSYKFKLKWSFMRSVYREVMYAEVNLEVFLKNMPGIIDITSKDFVEENSR